jgi:hypothetical protein
MPRELLAWKVGLIEAGAEYTNARLRHVKSDILLLARYSMWVVPILNDIFSCREIFPSMLSQFQFLALEVAAAWWLT